MIISCSNCGMNHTNGTCLAEELGYKYSSALQCEYFIPIDVGSKSDKSEVGKGRKNDRKRKKQL
jgi:hypothetical protein